MAHPGLDDVSHPVDRPSAGVSLLDFRLSVLPTEVAMENGFRSSDSPDPWILALSGGILQVLVLAAAAFLIGQEPGQDAVCS